MTKVNSAVTKVTTTAGKFGSAAAGLALGRLVTSRIPALDFLNKIPVVGAYLAALAPGSLVMVLAYLAGKKFNNDYADYGATGLGLAGFIDILKRTGLLDKVNSMIPGANLNGLGIVQNFGAYSPDYFLKSNWAERAPALNGPGADARSFSLQGISDTGAFGLQGAESDKKAFGLQGLGCMYQ